MTAAEVCASEALLAIARARRMVSEAVLALDDPDRDPPGDYLRSMAREIQAETAGLRREADILRGSVE